MLEHPVARTVVDALNAEQIPYLLVGSFSSNFYGIPRSTKDADFVIELSGKSVMSLLKDSDDIRDVLSVQQSSLDWDYIHKWCAEHQTRELLDRIRQTVPTT